MVRGFEALSQEFFDVSASNRVLGRIQNAKSAASRILPCLKSSTQSCWAVQPHENLSLSGELDFALSTSSDSKRRVHDVILEMTAESMDELHLEF